MDEFFVCELCGKKTKDIYVINLEGSILNVCDKCKNYGKVIKVIKHKQQENVKNNKISKELKIQKNKIYDINKTDEEETEETIINDYSQRIKRAREKLGLKQKELAFKINEKESLIQKVESNHLEPSLKLAKKLEKVLNIKLVEEIKKEKILINKTQTEIKLGNIIKIKQRKKLKK